MKAKKVLDLSKVTDFEWHQRIKKTPEDVRLAGTGEKSLERIGPIAVHKNWRFVAFGIESNDG
jgi:hypothetical protein